MGLVLENIEFDFRDVSSRRKFDIRNLFGDSFDNDRNFSYVSYDFVLDKFVQDELVDYKMLKSKINCYLELLKEILYLPDYLEKGFKISNLESFLTSNSAGEKQSFKKDLLGEVSFSYEVRELISGTKLYFNLCQNELELKDYFNLYNQVSRNSSFSISNEALVSSSRMKLIFDTLNSERINPLKFIGGSN